LILSPSAQSGFNIWRLWNTNWRYRYIALSVINDWHFGGVLWCMIFRLFGGYKSPFIQTPLPARNYIERFRFA